MKEVSLLEMIGRSVAKVAAGAGIAGVLIWLTYVMLDIGHMQSGFTCPSPPIEIPVFEWTSVSITLLACTVLLAALQVCGLQGC